MKKNMMVVKLAVGLGVSEPVLESGAFGAPAWTYTMNTAYWIPDEIKLMFPVRFAIWKTYTTHTSINCQLMSSLIISRARADNPPPNPIRVFLQSQRNAAIF